MHQDMTVGVEKACDEDFVAAEGLSDSGNGTYSPLKRRRNQEHSAKSPAPPKRWTPTKEKGFVLKRRGTVDETTSLVEILGQANEKARTS